MWRCALRSWPLAADGLHARTRRSRTRSRPVYLGIETILLDGDLVNFRVAMKGARDNADVEAYARCAAAQYALIRGFGFARHVRTHVGRRVASGAGMRFTPSRRRCPRA